MQTELAIRNEEENEKIDRPIVTYRLGVCSAVLSDTGHVFWQLRKRVSNWVGERFRQAHGGCSIRRVLHQRWGEARLLANAGVQRGLLRGRPRTNSRSSTNLITRGTCYKTGQTQAVCGLTKCRSEMAHLGKTTVPGRACTKRPNRNVGCHKMRGKLLRSLAENQMIGLILKRCTGRGAQYVPRMGGGRSHYRR